MQELLASPASVSITVVGDEPGGAYNRVQLPNVLAGLAGPASVELAGEDWYAARGVTLRAGVSAVRIDRRRRLLHLSSGPAVPYDVLVLATGSSAVLPPAAGLGGGGAGWCRARSHSVRSPTAPRSRRSLGGHGAPPCSAAASWAWRRPAG